MCGRTACTLFPDEVCKSCSTQTVDSAGRKTYQVPEWKDHPGGYSYTPSHNMAPSKFTPVIISEHHVKGTKRQNSGEENPPKHIIQPMMWGLIPPFYKGPSPNHGFKTNNCRIEGIEEKASYKPSLLKGQRCVVLCDGFYEWQTTKAEKKKQPYLIYVPQPEGVSIHERDSWDKPDVWDEEEGWKGPQMLKMAGLFSRWVSTEGDEVMSYTVITMESASNFSWLHHRVPAILQNQNEVQDWLDSGKLAYKEALAKLKPETEFVYHPVSSAVGNSRNQDHTLTVPISLEKQPPPETPASKLMSAWLNKAPTKTENKIAPNLIENTDFKSNNGIQKDKKINPLTAWLKKEDSGEKSSNSNTVKKEISNVIKGKDKKPNPLKNWLKQDEINKYNGKPTTDTKEELLSTDNVSELENELNEEILSESTSNNQPPSESKTKEKFPCPVCSENFNQDTINHHLDTHF